MINENIAYAKSILNKNGITQDSKEYSDYLRIREICGNNNGYVGILTKLRFIDNVSDMDEISSIFDVLKNSNIDINKLNKLSYDDILEMFYDELNNKVDKSDIELIYKDDSYSYYRVYTYKGIMKIGSPAWCLKTKSNWDSYQKSYPDQWVVISNDYKKGLIAPDNNYLQSYSNVKKTWIRYGVSAKINDDGTINWIGNDDNNGILKGNPDSFTSFGVICTIFNLIRGKKISYYDRFIGCEKIFNEWHKVIDKELFLKRFRLHEKMFINSEIYVRFSKDYNFIPLFLVFNNYSITVFFPSESCDISPVSLIKDNTKKIILDYAKKSDSFYFYGIKLANNLMTMEDIQNEKRFLVKFGKWFIFENINKSHYIIVNGEYNDTVDFVVSNYSVLEGGDGNLDLNNPVAWFIHKKTMKPVLQKFNENVSTYVPIKEYHTEVIEFLKKNYPSEIIEEKPKEEKKVKGFFDFLKRKKS
jgi:hypothetical protein